MENNKKFTISTSHIKYIALILMTLDHIGVVFNFLPLRFVGRLAFPLFAWAFGKAWDRTSNQDRFTKRLFLWGLLSQIPFYLAFKFFSPNIILSFFLVAVFLRKIDNSTSPSMRFTWFVAAMLLAEVLNFNYTWYAFPTILMMKTFRWNNAGWWVLWIIINVVYVVYTGVHYQMLAVFSPLLLANYSDKLDIKKPSVYVRNSFYIYYGGHLLVLAIVRSLLH